MNTSEHYSRFRWVILGQIVIVTMCSAIIMISFAPLMGVIAQDLRISIGSASFGFMGLHMLAMAVGCALSGYLIDRFGVFPVINCSVAVILVSNALLLWLGHSYWPIVAIRVIEALGCAPVFVAIGPATALWFPPREAGAALGLQSVAISAGIMLGLIVSPQLALSAGSWQKGIACLSIGIAAATVFVIGISMAAKRYLPPTATVAADTPPTSISSLVLTRPFLAGILGMSCGVWTQQTFNSLTPGYLAVLPPMGLGLGPLVAGKLMTTVMLAGIVSSLIGGILVDKACGGRVRPVVLTGFVLLIVCPVLLLIPQIYNQRPALILCLMLAGAATPFINPVILGFAAKTFPPSVVGRIVGSWMSVALFCGAAGVMVGAGALTSTGTYKLSMEIISAIAVLGFLASFFIYPATTDSVVALDSKAGGRSGCCSSTSPSGSAV
jgi:MFS family permease